MGKDESVYPKNYLDRVWFKTKPVGGHIPIESHEWEERYIRLKEEGISISHEGFYHMLTLMNKIDRKAFPLSKKLGCDPFDLENEIIDRMLETLDSMENLSVFDKLKNNHSTALPEISKSFKTQLDVTIKQETV